MKVYFIFLFFIGYSNCDCDYNCPCQDLMILTDGLPEWYTQENGIGCFQKFSCTSKEIYAESPSLSSNIPRTEDGILRSYLFNHSIRYNDLPVITKDLFIEFGLVCEDYKWWITKFPLGINGATVISSEEANGKGYRAEVEFLSW